MRPARSLTRTEPCCINAIAMEAAGFAVGLIGLAGLFSSCLEAIDRAQQYKSFASDSKALELQFTSTRVRFENWGRAVGFIDREEPEDDGEDRPKHHPALDDEKVRRATVEIFNFVREICDSPSAGKLHHGVGSSQPLEQPGAHGASSSRRKLAWAMGGKLRRTEQVELFKELVRSLYDLVPPDTSQAAIPIVNAWSTEFSQIVSRLEGGLISSLLPWFLF